MNGKVRQVDEMSVREVRQELTGLDDVIGHLADLRGQIERIGRASL